MIKCLLYITHLLCMTVVILWFWLSSLLTIQETQETTTSLCSKQRLNSMLNEQRDWLATLTGEKGCDISRWASVKVQHENNTEGPHSTELGLFLIVRTYILEQRYQALTWDLGSSRASLPFSVHSAQNLILTLKKGSWSLYSHLKWILHD